MNAVITNPAKDPSKAKAKTANVLAVRIGSSRLLFIGRPQDSNRGERQSRRPN